MSDGVYNIISEQAKLIDYTKHVWLPIIAKCHKKLLETNCFQNSHGIKFDDQVQAPDGPSNLSQQCFSVSITNDFLPLWLIT